ncbi:MAG: hypothetical protein ACTSX7_01550, partial [Alphaproteobacteria bacterium]
PLHQLVGFPGVYLTSNDRPTKAEQRHFPNKCAENGSGFKHRLNHEMYFVIPAGGIDASAEVILAIACLRIGGPDNNLLQFGRALKGSAICLVHVHRFVITNALINTMTTPQPKSAHRSLYPTGRPNAAMLGV